MYQFSHRKTSVVPFSISLLFMWRNGIVYHSLYLFPGKIFLELISFNRPDHKEVPDVGRGEW